MNRLGKTEKIGCDGASGFPITEARKGKLQESKHETKQNMRIQ